MAKSKINMFEEAVEERKKEQSEITAHVMEKEERSMKQDRPRKRIRSKSPFRGLTVSLVYIISIIRQNM